MAQNLKFAIIGLPLGLQHSSSIYNIYICVCVRCAYKLRIIEFYCTSKMIQERIDTPIILLIPSTYY